MVQQTKKPKRPSKGTTKKSTKKTGKRGTTRTASSYGYGVKSRTNVRLRSRYKHPYSSNYEFKVAKYMEENEIEFDYEPEKINYIYPIKAGLCSNCGSEHVGRRAIYTPDFRINSSGVWVETKGKWDSKGRTKILAVLDTSGSIDRDNFRMLFMYNNWITKAHKLTYMDWCEKHNIIAAVGTSIPEEWL